MPSSSNFSFLGSLDLHLAQLGLQAERYFEEDPNTCLMKLRQFGERMASLAAARIGLLQDPRESQSDQLKRLRWDGGLDDQVLDLFHHLRQGGNKAAHEMTGSHTDALANLRFARQLGIWYAATFNGGRRIDAGPFVKPSGGHAQHEAQLRKVEQERNEALAQIEAAQATAQEEARRRMSAEERAQKEAEDKTLLEALLAEAERSEHEALGRVVEFRQLQEIQAQAKQAPRQDIDALIKRANEASSGLVLDEAETRRLIDAQIRGAGWEVDTASITYSSGARPEDGKNKVIAEWPTDDGVADYVFFLGLMPVAVAEAKRACRHVSQDVGQAIRYSQAFRRQGLEAPGGPWAGYCIPFMYATNGRPFHRQVMEFSGIWFLDGRRPQNLRRALEGWHTPDGLLALLRQNQDEAHQRLRKAGFDYGVKLRPYQIKAIRAIEEALAEGKRTCLLAMATGTGKTKTAIGLMYRLLSNQRFGRILFVVDRKALGEQADEAFDETFMEGALTFSQIFTVHGLDERVVDSETKVDVVTIQALVGRVYGAQGPDRIPPVDQYDCIIIDECHRGYTLDRELSEEELAFRDFGDYISKYRRVLDHFDAVKIGLTATPALHTVQIFGTPIFEYLFREAVCDGVLRDYETPIKIHTALSKNGIHFNPGEPVEIRNERTGEIVTRILPDELAFDVEKFNREVVTVNFNRAVCQELAQQIDPEAPGKTLIFCATDDHADIVVNQLKKAFEDTYGEVDDQAVVKITAKADGPRQLLRRYKNEALPKVAVTVDLLTTGVDVPEIVNLVFLRRVNSRILFDQMLGRATRLCDAIGKETFRVFDAVQQFDHLGEITQMKPVVVNPTTTFAKLLEEFMRVEVPAHQQLVLDQFVGKYQRKAAKLTDHQREIFIELAGEPPETLMSRLREEGHEAAKDWFGAHEGFAQWLDEVITGPPHQRAISHHQDQVTEVAHGFANGQRPEEYLEAFRQRVQEDMNRIPALVTVLQRPRDLTRETLKQVRLALDNSGYPEAQLRTAWRDSTNEDIAANIIGYIRQAALGDVLIPYKERVQRGLQRILTTRRWEPLQQRWLRRLADQIALEGVLDAQSLDEGAFMDHGGLKRMDQIFQGRAVEVLGDLQEAIWGGAS
jgi:type I restriction enzyme R subunit